MMYPKEETEEWRFVSYFDKSWLESFPPHDRVRIEVAGDVLKMYIFGHGDPSDWWKQVNKNLDERGIKHAP